MNDNKKITIELPDGYKIVAEISTDPVIRELYVGIENQDGVWTQDLAVIRTPYEIKDGEIVNQEGKAEVLVYTDAESEDWTHSFQTDILHY